MPPAHWSLRSGGQFNYDFALIFSLAVGLRLKRAKKDVAVITLLERAKRTFLAKRTGRRVVFAVSKAPIGSNFLRGRQLHELVSPLLGNRGIESSIALDLEISDALVLLNKNVILGTTPDLIERLKRRRNIVVADPLDGDVPEEALRAVDALISSSHVQSDYFGLTFPEKPRFYVGHHVDIRIGPIEPRPSETLSIGYFGELYNALYSEELRSRIDFHRTNTVDSSDVSWMAQLRNYNAHYGMRLRQRYDGYKPFTKGFVAAHCGCPIIVSADDREAMLHLTNDYPFAVRDSSLTAVLAVMADMSAGFMGPRWRAALEIMNHVKAKSSHEAIANQLLRAIESLS